MPATLSEIIQSYEPISLSEMDSVALLNRKDTKYLFKRAQVEELLLRVKDNYRMLETAGTMMSKYNNIYFDTPALAMYHEHHNGKLNRYKVRHREYADSGIGFFEIKFKSNKERTVKERFRKDGLSSELNQAQIDLIDENTKFNAADLVESSRINFTRITLVNKDFTDRCTIDIDLEISTKNESKKFDWISICEIKQTNFSRNNHFIRALEAMGIRPMRVSKYCLSILYGYPGVKYNRFKQKMRHIDRLSK